MDAIAVTVGIVAMFGLGFLSAYFIIKQDMELKFYEAEEKLKNRLGESMQKNSKLEKDYQELASQIKALANPGTPLDKYNELYQKVRGKLST